MKVKYRESRMRFDSSGFGRSLPEFDLSGDANLNIKPYMPIRDKGAREHFAMLKKLVLMALHNANITKEPQTVEVGRASFTVYPGGKEKVVKGFKTAEW